MQLADSKPALDPFYYLANFATMLETLERRDGDLLAPEERTFIAEFANMPQASRALLVRMVMRKGPLFRSSRLRYCEIADTAGAIVPLIDLAWVDDRPPLELGDLFTLYRKSEVVELLALPKQHANEAKSLLLASLCGSFPGRQPLSHWCRSPDTVYRLEVGAVCGRLTAMFFGNFHQDLTEFVLADLGVFQYESRAVHPEGRPFRSRGEVEAFHQLSRCRELLHMGGEPGIIEELLPPPIADCDWLEDRREKIRFQIAHAWERAGHIDKAASLYAGCSYPEAGVRAHRIAEAAGGRVKRLARGAAVPAFDLYLEKFPPGSSVESQVRDHLRATADEESAVHYVENGLINSLFGLLCWPAIFAPVPGAFFHAFHHGPADLSNARFVERRHLQFASCLAELESEAYKETIARRFADKQGITAPFVAWGLIDEPLLRTALECFPAAHLKLWFEWMMRDLRVNRSGFPDLVQFYPGSRRYRLIEVKAPGDRLQDNQRRCLEYMAGHKVPVSVCRVHWSDG